MVGDVFGDACACCTALSTRRGESLNEEFLLCDFDLLARCLDKLDSARGRDENMMKCDDS